MIGKDYARGESGREGCVIIKGKRRDPCGDGNKTYLDCGDGGYMNPHMGQNCLELMHTHTHTPRSIRKIVNVNIPVVILYYRSA